MLTKKFSLADDFIKPELERATLAAIERGGGDVFWAVADLLPVDAFTVERDLWERVRAAFETDQKPALVSADWQPIANPLEAAHELAQLFRRRTAAQELEELAHELHTIDPASLSLSFEEAARRVARVEERLQSGGPLWGDNLIEIVLKEAAERFQQRRETGKPTLGVATGLTALDAALGGLRAGLHILGGAPGAGKTTLALQIVGQAAATGIPILYITFENSPTNLLAKALAARAGINCADIDKGFANPEKLRTAAHDLGPALVRMAFLEGQSSLGVDRIRARALQVMARCQSKVCLVVIDYLQRAAHGLGFEQLRHNVSAFAGELRDLSSRLDSPVLALSSLSRSGYGDGKSAGMDNLKESGDLEFSADSVMLLEDDNKRQVTPPARAVRLRVAKNRYGEAGRSIPLIFRPDICSLREEATR